MYSKVCQAQIGMLGNFFHFCMLVYPPTATGHKPHNTNVLAKYRVGHEHGAREETFEPKGLV